MSGYISLLFRDRPIGIQSIEVGAELETFGTVRPDELVFSNKDAPIIETLSVKNGIASRIFADR